MQYRRHDGGYEEIYTYADHLADFGVPLRGQIDMAMGPSYWRVHWRKAKRLMRIGWQLV